MTLRMFLNCFSNLMSMTSGVCYTTFSLLKHRVNGVSYTWHQIWWSVYFMSQPLYYFTPSSSSVQFSSIIHLFFTELLWSGTKHLNVTDKLSGQQCDSGKRTLSSSSVWFRIWKGSGALVTEKIFDASGYKAEQGLKLQEDDACLVFFSLWRAFLFPLT